MPKGGPPWDGTWSLSRKEQAMNEAGLGLSAPLVVYASEVAALFKDDPKGIIPARAGSSAPARAKAISASKSQPDLVCLRLTVKVKKVENVMGSWMISYEKM